MLGVTGRTLVRASSSATTFLGALGQGTPLSCFQKWDGGPVNLYRPLHFSIVCFKYTKEEITYYHISEIHENWTAGQHVQEVEFSKATKMHSANIYRRKILYLPGEKWYLHIRYNRIDWSCQSRFGIPLSLTTCCWKRRRKWFLSFLSYFGRYTFFHIPVNWNTLLLLTHRSCTDSFPWKLIVWTTEPQKDTPTCSTSHAINKRNVYFGLTKEKQGE